MDTRASELCGRVAAVLKNDNRVGGLGAAELEVVEWIDKSLGLWCSGTLH